MGVSYRPDNPFAPQEKKYRPDNPFAKPSALDQIKAGVGDIAQAVKHPLQTIGRMGKQAFEDFNTVALDNLLPDEVPAAEQRKAAINTGLNIGLAVAPEMGLPARLAVNAGVGAAYTPDQPLRGATTGLVLGEALHQGGKAIGAGARAVGREVTAPYTLLPDGSVEFADGSVHPRPANGDYSVYENGPPVSTEATSAPRLERRQAARTTDARVWTPEERANYITARQKEFASKVNKPWSEWTPEEKTAYFADQESVKQELVGRPAAGPPPLDYNAILAMSPREIEAAAEAARRSEKAAPVTIWGQEGAKRYEAAQRTVNSQFQFDRAKEEAATKTIREMEAGLTPAQEQLLFGIGEKGYNADELRAISEDANFYAHASELSTEDLLNVFGREMSTGSPLTNAGHAIRVREVARELGNRGVTIEDAIRGGVQQRVGRGYASQGDAIALTLANWNELAKKFGGSSKDFDQFSAAVDEVAPQPKATKTGRRKPVEGAVNPKYRLDKDETLLSRAGELLTRLEEYSSGEHGAPVFVRDAADLSKPISGQTSVANRMTQDKALFDEVRKELVDRGWPEADLDDAINEKWLNTGTEYRHAGLPPLSPAAKATAQGAINQLAGKPFTDLAQSIPNPVTRQAYEKVGGSIDFGDRQAKAIAKANKPTLFARIQQFADAVSNGLGPIERLGSRVENVLRPSKNPRELLSYAKSSDHTVKQAFDVGVLDPVSRKVAGPSYRSLFEPFAGDDAKIRMALTYLKAKRDVGRGLEGVGGDQAFLDAAHEVVRHSETDPQMVEFANKWNQYVDALGNYAVGSGLWTEDFVKALKESDALYLPYKRVLGPSVKQAGGPMTPGGDRYVNIGHGVKRFFGSKQSISNPALSIAEYTSAIIRRADQYRVGDAIFEAADALGPEGEILLTPIKGGADRTAKANAAVRARANNIPTPVMQELIDTFEAVPSGRNPVIWRNGPEGKQYALVNSPTLWRAVSHLNALEQSAVRDFLNITLRPLKRVFTAATTGLVPRFSLATNPVRDVVDAFAKSRAGITPKDVANGYYEALKDIFSRSGTAAEAEHAGMGGVSMFFGEATPSAVARRFAPTTPLDKVISAAHFTATRPLRALERLGEMSDKGPRAAEYMAFIRKNQHKVDSGEWTEADLRLGAATAGRGVALDFQNRPGNQVLRFLGDYIPFFNVGLQAPIQFGIAAYRNPRRLIGASAGVASAATLAWAMKHALGPDVQQQLNDRQSTERAGFILVPLDYAGNAWRVPLGQEMGVIASAVTAGLDAAFESDPHAGRLLATSLLRAMPPGISEALQANPTIPIPGVQQMLENAKNRRDYGGHPIVPERMKDLPPAERRYETTNPTFDLLAAGARSVGFSEFSPLEAENLMRGVTSQATPFITAAVDPWAEKLLGRGAQPRLKPPILQQPLNPASTMIARNPPPSTESEQDYYALKTKVEQANTFLSQAANANQVSAIPRLRGYKQYLNPDLAAGIKVTDQVLKELRDNEGVVREMFQSGELPPDRAREELDKLRTQRQLVYRRATTILAGMMR